MPHLVDFDQCLRVARETALSAGASLFLPNYVKSLQDKNVDIKDGNTSNLVTETDRRLQEYVKERLLAAFPSHKFMGEESDTADGDEEALSDDPTWIVDPIDGTTNFVHQFKMTVISIALSVDKQPVVGVIYCPVTNELFEAAIGSGAFLNRTRLAIDATGLTLTSSLILTEFGATGNGSVELVAARMDQLSRLIAHRVHGIRMLGSAAYNLAQVAAGAAQVYFETGIHAWDIAAGVLILREAGGVVRELCGGDGCAFRLNGRSIVAAASAQIMNELCVVLNLNK